MSRKVKVKKYFQNDKTYITVADNNLLIMQNNIPDRALSAIKVCKGFYIELGRSINEFNEILLKHTRVPVMFIKVIEKDSYTMYNMVRMQTGNIEDVVLGSLVCYTDTGIIKDITCSKAYIKDEDFLKYEEIGSLWKVRVKHTENVDKNKSNIENLVKVLSAYDRLSNASIDINYYTCKAEATVCSEELNYKYTFILNEIEGYFELIMVSLI